MFNRKMDEMETKIELYCISRAFLCGVICLCIWQLTYLFSGDKNYAPLMIIAAMSATRGICRIIIKKRCEMDCDE